MLTIEALSQTDKYSWAQPLEHCSASSSVCRERDFSQYKGLFSQMRNCSELSFQKSFEDVFISYTDIIFESFFPNVLVSFVEKQGESDLRMEKTRMHRTLYVRP